MAIVAIVDFGVGNLRSVQKAVERAAADAGLAWNAVITDDPDAIARADKVIVPGQGAFRDCAVALGRGIGAAVRAQIDRGTLYLGICMGLQTLFASSEEAPGLRGARPSSAGRTCGSPTGSAIQRPAKRSRSRTWAGTASSSRARGIRTSRKRAARGRTSISFTPTTPCPSDRSLVVATVQHGPFQVTAAVARDNVFASQFHPEKSQAAGLALLAAFLEG